MVVLAFLTVVVTDSLSYFCRPKVVMDEDGGNGGRCTAVSFRIVGDVLSLIVLVLSFSSSSWNEDFVLWSMATTQSFRFRIRVDANRTFRS